MRRLVLAALAICTSAFSQVSPVASGIRAVSTLPATCPGGAWVRIKTGASNPGLYDCPVAGGAPRLIAIGGNFTARGAYAAGTTYAALDLVSYNGAAYVSMAGSNIGHAPSSSPTWWAQPGPQGPAGAAGTATPYSCALSAVSSITCTHSLGTSLPWVSCYDSGGHMLGGTGSSTSVTSVTAVDTNNVSLTFSGATTGTCSISSGDMGPQGSAGADGANGTSATSTTEAPGANCTYGGIRVVDAGGTHYVCSVGGDVSTSGTNTYTSAAVNDARSAAHTLPTKTGAAASKPATCTVGETYFANDATAGQNLYYCTAINTWTQQIGGVSVSAGTGISVSGSTISFNPFDNSALFLTETFCGGGGETSRPVSGTHGWAFGVIGTGTPTQAQAVTVDENHVCGVNIKGPATTSNGAFLALLPSNGTGTVLSDIWTSSKYRPTEFQVQFRLSSTSNIRFWIGLSNKSASAIPTGFTVGCFLRYDTTVSDTAYMAQCGDGSALTTAVSVAGTVDTNPHRLRVRTTAAGTFAFSIDGGTETTVSKTMPTGTKMVLGIQISNDGTSTTSAVDLYRAGLLVTGLSVN